MTNFTFLLEKYFIAPCSYSLTHHIKKFLFVFEAIKIKLIKIDIKRHTQTVTIYDLWDAETVK